MAVTISELQNLAQSAILAAPLTAYVDPSPSSPMRTSPANTIGVYYRLAYWKALGSQEPGAFSVHLLKGASEDLAYAMQLVAQRGLTGGSFGLDIGGEDTPERLSVILNAAASQLDGYKAHRAASELRKLGSVSAIKAAQGATSSLKDTVEEKIKSVTSTVGDKIAAVLPDLPSIPGPQSLIDYLGQSKFARYAMVLAYGTAGAVALYALHNTGILKRFARKNPALDWNKFYDRQIGLAEKGLDLSWKVGLIGVGTALLFVPSLQIPGLGLIGAGAIALGTNFDLGSAASAAASLKSNPNKRRKASRRRKMRRGRK